ncbi:DUF4381 domain-containing protein [Pseudomonas putida CSV86]|uniref:DUF4381 domain-containing protein n=1 Tax=Pseudomonas bharatica CSV86 TaxID=1005395 RepID=L1LWF7_9PSED|nr:MULTISPECIES: DUF4381 domain-containing protein [Pseudomonas]MDG9881836.1 DUF4381 domain-containing protein [Pseudomonas sp. GD04058]NNJ17207.1 DUF4381 domain-containing protein [Pseudomonas bharatica CSV86]
MTRQVPDIDQLQEIALPAPVSYWPQTWGWTVLLILLLAAVLVWALRAWRHWQRNRYRREALARLDALERRLEQHPDDCQALRALPELLKRVALSMPGGRAVAPLHDSQWQAFLVAHASAPLPDNFAQLLAHLAYAPQARLHEVDARELLRHSRAWVEQHHVAA